MSPLSSKDELEHDSERCVHAKPVIIIKPFNFNHPRPKKYPKSLDVTQLKLEYPGVSRGYRRCSRRCSDRGFSDLQRVCSLSTLTFPYESHSLSRTLDRTKAPLTLPWICI